MGSLTVNRDILVPVVLGALALLVAVPLVVWVLNRSDHTNPPALALQPATLATTSPHDAAGVDAATRFARFPSTNPLLRTSPPKQPTAVPIPVAPREDNPLFKGVRLSRWLELADDLDPATRKEALHAIDQINRAQREQTAPAAARAAVVVHGNDPLAALEYIETAQLIEDLREVVVWQAYRALTELDVAAVRRSDVLERIIESLTREEALPFLLAIIDDGRFDAIRPSSTHKLVWVQSSLVARALLDDAHYGPKLTIPKAQPLRKELETRTRH